MSKAQSTDVSNDSLNDISVASWEANAAFWDDFMGDEGNEFFNVLEMPAVERLTAVKEGDHILDLATGNGLLARRLANLGAIVRATDASQNLIKLAEQRTTKDNTSRITYSLLDVTKDTDFDRMIEEARKVILHQSQMCSTVNAQKQARGFRHSHHERGHHGRPHPQPPNRSSPTTLEEKRKVGGLSHFRRLPI